MAAKDAKMTVVVEALLDHLFVAWFKNVQGKGHAGQQHEIQRKQRQKCAHKLTMENDEPPRNNLMIVRCSLTCLGRQGTKPGMELAGKIAVVTGASMGIGEAIAKIFVEHEAAVVLLARDSSRAEAARTRIGRTDQTLALACDVRNREEIDRTIGLTMHHFQRIDIWVNNAGRGVLDSV